MPSNPEPDRYPLAHERLDAFERLLRRGLVIHAKQEHDLDPDADIDFDPDIDLDDDDPNYDEDVAKERAAVRDAVEQAEKTASDVIEALQWHDAVALAEFLGHGQTDEVKAQINAALLVAEGRATFHEELAKGSVKPE